MATLYLSIRTSLGHFRRRLKSSFGGKWVSYRTTSCDVNKYDVGGLMSYLRYVCSFSYSGVNCVMFFFCLSSSCVPYVASFSELSIFDRPFDIV
jgi:hypothetical protein